MKDNIMMFIIGFLVGAIISSAGFMIYSNVSSNKVNNNQEFRMNDRMGQPPQDDNGQPREIPENGSEYTSADNNSSNKNSKAKNSSKSEE
jgi:gas vesicle protein